MREFATISAFVQFLETRQEAVRIAQKHGLDAAGEMIVHAAQATIGEYQDAAGPFKAWPELTEATLEGGVSAEGHYFPGKIELGYAPPDNPLLRTGHMRGSIEHAATESEVIVGTHDPVAADQEFGTVHIPARSFIGASTFRKAHEATDLAVKFIINAFAGWPRPHVPTHNEHG